jgi:two-component system chemotaxis response regulator CheY
MARIVVVDDSKLMRMLLKEILVSAGHEVECWEEVPEVEIPAMVIASDPNLIITDYNMPGCDGAALVRMVRQGEPNLPIIMLTATRDPEVMAKLVQQSPIRILYKPLKPEELLQALKDLL